MKTMLQFDFIVDKEKNTITVKREFAASRKLVWDAYTKSELLEKWFAPKPFTAKTKTMDFREGGHWLYAMVSPDGKEHWGRMDYQKIRPVENYSGLDAFCDEHGVMNANLPRAHWDVNFSDTDKNALVKTVITYNSLADLEVVVKMGMKEGLTMTLDNLDDLLLELTNQK